MVECLTCRPNIESYLLLRRYIVLLQDEADHANVLLPIKNQLRRIEMMKPLYENIITKTYRFPTNADTQLSVHEYLGESKLTFYLPRQFL